MMVAGGLKDAAVSPDYREQAMRAKFAA